MRTLFIMILMTVFFGAQIIVPDAFKDGDDSITAEVVSQVSTLDSNLSAEINMELTAPETAVPAVPVQTAAPTETPVPDSDPEIVFGSPKVTDTFERGSSGFGLNAGLNDDDAIRILALDSKLTIEPKKNNGWISWRLRPPAVADAAAEMDFSIFTCARGDRAGLILRAEDYNNGHGYYISLACEGLLTVLKDTTVIATANVSDLFHNNSGDVNTLTASAIGDTIVVRLNGQEALTVQDSTFPQGFSGFFVSPQGQNTLKMDILSYKLYYNE